MTLSLIIAFCAAAAGAEELNTVSELKSAAQGMNVEAQAAPAIAKEKTGQISPTGLDFDVRLGFPFPIPIPPGPQPHPPQPYPPQPYPPQPAPQSYTCTASDKGWEEHWGGHSASNWNLEQATGQACAECKRAHGRCGLWCGTPAYQCKAELLENGRTRIVMGYPNADRYYAERDAMDRCQYEAHYSHGYCRMQGCETVWNTVRQQDCP